MLCSIFAFVCAPNGSFTIDKRTLFFILEQILWSFFLQNDRFTSRNVKKTTDVVLMYFQKSFKYPLEHIITDFLNANEYDSFCNIIEN